MPAQVRGVPSGTALLEARHDPHPLADRRQYRRLLTALPGRGKGPHKVALLAAHGVMGSSLLAAQAALLEAGVIAVVVAPRHGLIETADGAVVEATASFENAPPALFDAVLLPDGEIGVKALRRHAQALDFVDQQFRDGKTLLALGASRALLDEAGIETGLAAGAAGPGVRVSTAGNGTTHHATLISAITAQRLPAGEVMSSRV